MEDESGADRVAEVLDQGTVYVPFVVLMEVYYITFQEQGEDVADHRYALLKQQPIDIQWTVDEPTLLTAGRLKATHAISFADAVIAAMASRLGAVLVHKDPEFDALSEDVHLEALPYKKSSY